MGVSVHGVGEVNQWLDGEKSMAEIDLVVASTCGFTLWAQVDG